MIRRIVAQIRQRKQFKLHRRNSSGSPLSSYRGSSLPEQHSRMRVILAPVRVSQKLLEINLHGINPSDRKQAPALGPATLIGQNHMGSDKRFVLF